MKYLTQALKNKLYLSFLPFLCFKSPTGLACEIEPCIMTYSSSQASPCPSSKEPIPSAPSNCTTNKGSCQDSTLAYPN